MQINSAVVQTLSALNKRFIHNFVTNDVASHDAILHPGFRAIYSAGNHVDRVSYLKYWATGFDPEVITYWDMRDQHINVYGDVALVGAANRWTRVRDGEETLGMTCYTDTYIRVGENWLCILAQLTPVASENYPPDDTIVVKYLRGVLQ
ncbi:MAG: nuclear transport factor 2 family protein [Burkholderiaceae bacterium]|nr:nuclear transport factor 2 family protein [Sulfuritalea sp.]MCF8174830.1 nuclear transport factor 2 family protein [Burkholderiaceae bacterium]